jgi:hypothetical protein
MSFELGQSNEFPGFVPLRNLSAHRPCAKKKAPTAKAVGALKLPYEAREAYGMAGAPVQTRFPAMIEQLPTTPGRAVSALGGRL